MSKLSESGLIRNFVARSMKQRSKKINHRNMRRSKDARKSWKRDQEI